MESGLKTIIAGSRGRLYAGNQPDILAAVKAAIDACPWSENIIEVVSGTARGVDRAGEQWASINNIPVKRFPANWDLYGKSAGYLRNKEMAEYAHALIAVWDGQSMGTMHMINLAKVKKLKIFVWRVDAQWRIAS